MPQIHVNCALCDTFLQFGMMLDITKKIRHSEENQDNAHIYVVRGQPWDRKVVKVRRRSLTKHKHYIRFYKSAHVFTCKATPTKVLSAHHVHILYTNIDVYAQQQTIGTRTLLRENTYHIAIAEVQFKYYRYQLRLNVYGNLTKHLSEPTYHISY